MKKIAIIGSGFGGLALAVRLQARGFHVTIFEKNSKVGGHAYPLERSGYRFDMGPSLITAPDIIQDVFKTVGNDLFQDLEMVKLDPFYRVYFHDSSFLDYSDDTEKMKEQIGSFNKKDAARYDAFMKASKQIYDAVIGDGLGKRPFNSIKSLMSFAPRALKLNALIPTYQFAKKYFKDERNRFIFSFHPLFIGGNPFRAPSVYEMIPFLEKEGGVWYSKGGMYSLVEALEKCFIEAGGTVKVEHEVSEILVEDKRAVGVKVKEQIFNADAVVSNADFIHTYRDLLPSSVRQKWTNRRLDRLHYSMSAFLIYLGVGKKYPQLKHHTLILSHRYKELITDIFDRHILPDDFSMYLHVPSRTDPEMAPEDKESMYVLIPVTNLKADINWQERGESFASQIIDYLENQFGLEGLRQHIEVLDIFTPLDFKNKRNSTYGSAWGVEPRLSQTAFFRPYNRCNDIKNIYLVGASTHPGAGLPGCFLTAETTESLIIQNHVN